MEEKYNLEYSRKSKHIQLFHTFFTYEKIPLGYEKQFEINVFWMYNILKFICTQYIPPYLYVLILFIYFFFLNFSGSYEYTYLLYVKKNCR